MHVLHPRLDNGNDGWFSTCWSLPSSLASSFWTERLVSNQRAVMIAAAALPVAGNVYMLAQHYGVAPTRVSTAILVSTAISIITVSLVVGWVSAI